MQVARQQNSIITSLSELREIENQRIAEDRAVIQRAEAARLAERAAAEQRVRDEEQARVRAAHEAQLALERARLEAEREARLRIDAAAAAELARQQVVLEHTRMEEELKLRRAALAKTRPTWMVAVTCVATLAAGVLVWFALSSRNSTEDARAKARHAEIEKERAKEAAREAQVELARIGQELESNSAAIKQAIKRVELAENQAASEKAAADLRREEERWKANMAAKKKAEYELWLKKRREGVDVSADCKNGVFAKGCDGQ